MTEANIRNKIRQQIKPFRRERLFPTGWNGELTFEQIAEDVTPRVIWKFKRYGVYGQDIPDCLQSGLMRLWEVLIETPDLLADENLVHVMWIVIRGATSTKHIRYHQRYTMFTDIVRGSEYHADEYGVSGLTSPREWWCADECWATWASKVDFRIDITEAFHTIAEEYDDDMKGMIALYILTTDVEPMETIATFGHPKSMIYERFKGIRDRLQRLLNEYEPIKPRTWQERLEAGEVEPYLKVVEHYQDKPLALMALYTLTTRTNNHKYTSDRKQRKMITYYRKKCLKRIKVAYGQAASF